MKDAIPLKSLEFLRQIITILFLLSFIVLIIPINTSKSLAKQFSTSIPNDEENGSSKTTDLNEFDVKILNIIKQISFSNDIFYILTREKFSHYIHHVFPVDWLETFSPPPDVA